MPLCILWRTRLTVSFAGPLVCIVHAYDAAVHETKALVQRPPGPGQRPASSGGDGEWVLCELPPAFPDVS